MTPAHEDILDAMTTAVVRLDAADRLEYLNPAAAGLLETGLRQARGRGLLEWLPLDNALDTYIKRARANGAPLAVAELVLACGPPPGRRRRVACDIQPLDDGGTQLELHPLERRQLIAGEAGLLQSQRAQRLLFQALAHEIKNPLGGLRGAAQLLAAETADPVQREYLDVMLRETDRLRDLVDELLGPTRVPRFTPTNIHSVLEHVRNVLEPGAAGTHWRRDYDPSLPDLAADADQLMQVFFNLIGNALEAMSGAGELYLRTRIERQYTLAGKRHRMAIRVDVEDNGPGVPAALRDTLFMPLVTGRADGTGLGLAIAQDIVQRHGGVIDWSSEAGRTVFSVILPVSSEPPPEETHD